MIIDVNAYLGRWPFRPLPNSSAEQLLALMDRKGIDMAVVSSLNAVFYRNSQAGNEELVAEIAPYPDRFIPFATINPTYAAWEEDVVRCCEKLGMRGIRIYPYYHGYAVEDPCCANLLTVAAEHDLPVALPLRMEDRRQQHWMDTAEDVSPRAVGELVKRFPEIKLIVLNGIGSVEDWSAFRDAPVLIDISRLSNLRLRPPPRDSSIPGLLAALGSDKLAFGTGIPIKYPDPAFLKVDILDADEQVKERIRWRNAAEMLGLEDASWSQGVPSSPGGEGRTTPG